MTDVVDLPPGTALVPLFPGARTEGVPFARQLRGHGDRLAVVAHDGETVTYRELAERVDEVADRLGGGRRLVLVAATPDFGTLVVYLAALAAGHPVLLASPDDETRYDRLVTTYDPDVLYRGGRLHERRRGSAHDLHPELAMLLSTSGSTGSPKLVRLSGGNVQANATSIADYLDIRDTDRAVVSLPLHYCYGLSVVNSNLLRGAALLLTGHSVVTPGFWDLVRTWRATSLHGVPHTFDLLDTAGFAGMDLPDLRYVTQAGGRLAPDRVRRLAAQGQRQGWRLFAMYGQTEATARMAYLPPELAATHPGTIGIPVPGGSFDLAADGELVYRGPNVMLGYAAGRADLALGRTVDALATGDLARRTPEGLYELIGRKSRFVKLFGLRIDLDEVERLLAEAGYEAACAGDDRALAVAVTGPEDGVLDLVTARLGLPPHAVRVHRYDELPRLATGKIDYPAITRAPATSPAPPATVRAALSRVLGRDVIDDDATFVSLGGDSLSHVRMSIELDRILGTIPEGWPTTPVRDLDRLRPRRRRLARVETNVVLRALAIVLVVGTHVGLFHVLGGAHLLLVLAGWGFARFGRAVREILGSAGRIALPAVAWLGYRVLTEHDVVLANVLLLSNYSDHAVARGYWFIEVLVQTLLVLALLFAIPAVRRAERRAAFGFALAALGLALVANVVLDGTGQPFDHAMSTHGAAWFFVLGWLAQRAGTAHRRLLVAAITLVLVPGYFANPVREGVIIAGVLLLLTVPRIALPKVLVPALGLLAGASLYIYLTHYATYPPLLAHFPPGVVFVATVGAGVLTWLAVDRGRTAIRRWR